MYSQIAKQRVDIGEVGNASTGDILYDGGKKINENFDAIYNSFGDQRLFQAGMGVSNQKIHATSYYQKGTPVDYNSNPVALGSCHDLSMAGGQAYRVTLPKGKVGEAVFFINSDGTINQSNSITFYTSNPDGFATGGNQVKVGSPYTRVEFWCIKEGLDGKAVWDYSVTSLFGQNHIPIEKTYLLPKLNANDKPTTISLFGMKEFNTVKLLLSYVADVGQNIRQSAEVILMIDSAAKKVYSSEYAVLQSGQTDADKKAGVKILDVGYTITAAENVAIELRSGYSSARLAIKTISTQLVGTGSNP